ncbi:MAG: hypothetical protein R2724_13210 [Bryobacterales bacterium]
MVRRDRTFLSVYNRRHGRRGYRLETATTPCGTVSKIEKGKLSLKTNYAGTIAIDWTRCKTLTPKAVTGGGRGQASASGELQRDQGRVDVRNEDVGC